MNFNKITSTTYFNVVGLLVVGGLTIGTIIPTNTWLGELLTSYALLVMLFFLISGFIGFIWRKNTVILFNFLACIAVCSFLKKQDSTVTQAWFQEEATVNVANLNLYETSDLIVLEQHLEDIAIDFLSLHVASTVDLPISILENFKKRLPYHKIINIDKENRTLVFSNYQMKNLDTFHYIGNQSVSLVGTLSMTEEKAIPFISTNIPIVDYELPKAQKHWIKLSQYMANRYELDPSAATNNVYLTTWQPVVDAFHNTKSLPVKKTEYSLDVQQAERLFYAENLICKQVENLLDGQGAVAMYKFVGNSSSNDAFTGSLRGGATL